MAAGCRREPYQCCAGVRVGTSVCYHSLVRGALAAGLASLLALGAASAEAQVKRVVVESFRGPQSGRLRASLLANLQDQEEVELVSEAEVRRAARELGIRDISAPSDYARIARELDVAAFIDGRTGRQRRSWSLTVRVRDGSDGRVLDSTSWSGRTIGALSTVRRNGYRRLQDVLESSQAPASRGRGRTPPRRPPPRRPPVVEEEEEEEEEYVEEEEEEEEYRPPPRRGRGRGRAVQEDEEEEEEEEEEPAGGGGGGEEPPWWVDPEGRNLQQRPGEDDEDPSDADDDDDDEEAVPDDDRHEAFALMFHVGALRRSMVVPGIRVFNRLRDPTLPVSEVIEERRQYVSGGPGHAELGVEMELYPGAFSDTQPLPFFGLVGRYHHSAFLVSKGPTRAGDIIDVGTSQSEIYVGARGRYRLGDGPQFAQLTADIGYGLFDFTLDTAHLVLLEPSSVIPPLQYSHVQLGVGFSYVLAPRWLTASASASARLGLGIGRDAKAIWGVDTTAANGWQIQIRLRSEAPYVAEGVFIGATFEYFMFTTQFSGQTACATSPCMGDIDMDMDGRIDVAAEPEPWEQWPQTDDGQVTGGIPTPVQDTYMRFGIFFGYAM
jgi:hypothetical protein